MMSAHVKSKSNLMFTSNSLPRHSNSHGINVLTRKAVYVYDRFIRFHTLKQFNNYPANTNANNLVVRNLIYALLFRESFDSLAVPFQASFVCRPAQALPYAMLGAFAPSRTFPMLKGFFTKLVKTRLNFFGNCARIAINNCHVLLTIYMTLWFKSTYALR